MGDVFKGMDRRNGLPPIDALENRKPLETQVGGGHYLKFKIQPIEFISENKLGWHEGNVVKYVCRWEAKGGLEDLLKAKDYLEKLIAKQGRREAPNTND